MSYHGVLTNGPIVNVWLCVFSKIKQCCGVRLTISEQHPPVLEVADETMQVIITGRNIMRSTISPYISAMISCEYMRNTFVKSSETQLLYFLFAWNLWKITKANLISADGSSKNTRERCSKWRHGKSTVLFYRLQCPSEFISTEFASSVTPPKL